MTDAPKLVLTPLGDAGLVCEGDVCEIPQHGDAHVAAAPGVAGKA